MESITNYLSNQGISLAGNVVGAILIVVIGLYLSNLLTKLFVKALQKTEVEATLVGFLKSIVSTALKFYVFFTAATKLGFSTGSLVAIIGTIGAALALGFKDSLGSLVSGILILFTKPFLVGDYIEVAGMSGTVKSIQMMTTNLITPDYRTVSIPNNTIATSTVINYSKSKTRRVDINFEVSYNTDVDLAKNLIMKCIMNHDLVLKNEEAFVRVTEYAASSIVITARAWAKNSDYWTVKFDLLEAVKKEFDANGVEIPYNQIDVHMKGE